jgi:hypothetical protein
MSRQERPLPPSRAELATHFDRGAMIRNRYPTGPSVSAGRGQEEHGDGSHVH